MALVYNLSCGLSALPDYYLAVTQSCDWKYRLADHHPLRHISCIQNLMYLDHLELRIT